MTRPDVSFRTLRVPSRAPTAGPTFVLLHGIGLSHRSFTGLARHLSASGDVVSFDLPGFGPTPRPRVALGVEDHAALVADRLRRAGVGPAVVLGHSMGAQFAVELARQDPAAVDRLVLVGPVVDSRKPTLTAQALSLARDSPLEPPATQAMVTFDYFRCGIPWFMSQALAMRDYPIERAIADVAQPVLVVRGEHDPIADARWVERLAGRAPDGRTATIPGYRHNVVHSGPEATAAVVTAFAAESARGGVGARG
jgi:pimeloyl-ACP methyl ester carboxylesterase